MIAVYHGDDIEMMLLVSFGTITLQLEFGKHLRSGFQLSAETASAADWKCPTSCPQRALSVCLSVRHIHFHTGLPDTSDLYCVNPWPPVYCAVASWP